MAKHQVEQLALNDNGCGWLNQLPTVVPSAALNGEHNVDWLIIGTGFTGLAFARQMAIAKPNARIVLIDAAGVGAGASSRNSGFAVATSSMDGPVDTAKLAEFSRINRINQAGIDSLRQITQSQQIECDWADVGKYHCSAQSSGELEAKHFSDWLSAANVDYRELNATELKAQLGTGYYQRGIWTKSDVMLQPAALVQGLLRTLPKNVEYYGHSPMTAWKKQGSQIEVETPQAKIRASNLVLATNALLHTMTSKPSYTVPLTLTASLSRVLTLTEQAALSAAKQWGVLSLHNSGATVRYTADHRILIRNTYDYVASGHLHDVQMKKAQQLHVQSLRARFPMLPDLNFEHTWQGVLCASRNSSSLFGKLEDNVFAAGCYNASGIARGSALGFLLADYALSHKSELLNDALDYPHPSWLPPRPLLDLIMKTEVARRKWTVGADL